MSIQNTQTRRAAPLAGDGNGNPSPRAVPDQSRAQPFSSPVAAAPRLSERDTCGRASSTPLGRLSIQTRRLPSPGEREAGHGSGFASFPVAAGPAANQEGL